MGRGAWIGVWGLAVAAVLVVTVLPLSAVVDHPHWHRVAWIPFVDDGGDTWELAANLLLFLPFGYAGVRVLGPGRRSLVRVVALGALLSLGVESVQLFSHGRFPSSTDLVVNTAGAALAAALARRELLGEKNESA